VLERAGCSVDLSAEAFPYMGVREATVAGIPVRMLRVGFVGELGYEVHCAASHGEALWDRLIEAGKPDGLRPFGVEAQRVLRLEKGHIIIGQDTDAMTTPDEVEMAWAIAGKKPFFVGGRSIEMRRRHPSARKLLGFTLPAGEAVPEESNLVLTGDKVTGFVTSAARSEALGKVIGLAYGPADKVPGDKLPIKYTSGRIVEALVVAPHFYDHDNKRQEL
jgi:sarcosine oxidase subunit alpha